MKRIAISGLLLLASLPVSALELEGVRLADKVQAGAQPLVLNGAGVRTRLIFKVYVAALYLPQKQASAATILSDEKERRVALHILRDLSSDKLLGAMNEAIAANHTPAELAALDTQLKQLARIFEAVREVKEGDVVTLDYLPATGTHIAVNGVSRGVIAGVAFNRALLKIWLGSQPVQDDLKKGLLGG